MQLRLTIDYEGTAYRGWQLQPGGATVQEVIELALRTALREPVRARAAGRTDAGVHACGQVVAVRVTREPADLGRLLKSLNALTPPDVAVREIAVVDDAFDPRRHARSRVYEYHLLNRVAPSPFYRRYAWHVPDALDVAAMDAAARQLCGEHDFAAFRAADAEPVRSTIRRVTESRMAVAEPLLVYHVEANAFLKHMVRNIVGTLVEVGRGQRPPASLAALLAGRDRTRAAATAPPHGLILLAVRY
jgi:tRNA pseudouridine38-40 synthase